MPYMTLARQGDLQVVFFAPPLMLGLIALAWFIKRPTGPLQRVTH